MAQVKENGREIWYIGVRRLYRAGSLMTVVKQISKYVRFSGSTGGQMGQRWHQTSRQIYIFLGMGIVN
jgi:hypothetical protein